MMVRLSLSTAMISCRANHQKIPMQTHVCNTHKIPQNHNKVNHYMDVTMTVLLTKARLKEILRYNYETGDFTNRITRKGGKSPEGATAGCINKENGCRALIQASHKILENSLMCLNRKTFPVYPSIPVVRRSICMSFKEFMFLRSRNT